MADKSLEVKITADTTQLVAQKAIAQAQLKDLGATVRDLGKQYIAAGADTATLNPILERNAALYAQAQQRIAALNAQMKEMVHPEVTGFFGKLSESVRVTGDSLENLHARLSVVSRAFNAFSEVALVGFGGEFLVDQVNKVAELGESYGVLQEKTGATAQQLGGLRVAAAESGTSFDAVGNGLRELGNKMQDAIIHPSGETAKAFKAAGIDIQDTATGQMLPVVDVFAAISKAMSTYQDGSAKTALAGDLIGSKFGDSLIPIMNLVGQGFDQLQQKGQALGITMSGTDIKASQDFMVVQSDLRLAMEGVRTQIVASNMPALTALEQEFIITAQKGGALSDSALVLEYGLKGVADVTVAVVTGISEVADMAYFLGNVLGDVALDAYALSQALQGNFRVADTVVKETTADIGKSWSDMLQKMSVQEKLYSDTSTALWTSPPVLKAATTMTTLGQHQGASDQPAPQLEDGATGGSGGRGGGDSTGAAKSNQDQLTEIAADGASARKEIVTAEYATQVAVWDSEVTTGKMTKATEIQDEIAAQTKIYEAELATETKVAQLAAAGTVAKAKALDDIQVLTAQHNAEIARMNSELVTQQVADAKKLLDEQTAAAAKTAQAWQQAFQPISTAFSSSVSGIIQGTETLRQAELKAAQSMLLAYADAAAKKVVVYLAGDAMILARGVMTEAGLTAATAGGEAARLAIKSAADATGKAISMADGSAQITHNALTAASGAYSAVAGIPYVGPVLAPVAAATAFAGVMAFDVLSAEGGMMIGGGVNPLVQLHEREMVLPSHIAQPLQSALGGEGFGGGDVTNNFHFNARGGAGGSSADDMLGALNDAVRSGRLQKYPAIARMMRRGG